MRLQKHTQVFFLPYYYLLFIHKTYSLKHNNFSFQLHFYGMFSI